MGTKSLQELPLEVLINICSFLEEPDILVLQSTNTFFHTLLHDQEFWKKLTLNKLSTLCFPSISRQPEYYKEFYQRKYALQDWKHNKVVKNKYTINPYRHIQTPQIERIIFQYPRCYLYNDGIITVAQLNNASHSTNRRSKFTYIPCTTPQGCSTMDFNLHAAVFGRFDGRVFAKLLTNKSFLQPVVEFNDTHQNQSCVTAINIIPMDQEGKKHVMCVSGSESGELCWWQDTKLISRYQLTLRPAPIIKLFIFNRDNQNYTIAIDSHLQIYIILNRDPDSVITVDHSLPPQLKINDFHFIKIDYGAMNLILITLTTIYVISIDPNSDLGHCKTYLINVDNDNTRTESSITQERIKDVYIDEPTALKRQELAFAGGDGCYIAIVLESNDILIINIRESLSTDPTKLRLHKRLIFNEIITSCQINNTILAVTLEDNLKIIDPTTGDLLKTVSKVDKLTQFIRIFDNKIITTTSNNLNYYQFNPTHKHTGTQGPIRHSHGRGSKSTHHHQALSNKWNININTARQLFDEEEDLNQRRINENARLLNEYGGDLNRDTPYNHVLQNGADDEEDINLRIALLESQQSEPPSSSSRLQLDDEDEQLRRAIEESERLQQEMSIEENDDQELRRILELSRQEHEQHFSTTSPSVPLSSTSSTTTATAAAAATVSRQVPRNQLPLSHSAATPQSRVPTNTNTTSSSSSSSHLNAEDDEDLALAIALSLSEIE